MKSRTPFILSLTAIMTLVAGNVFGAYSGGSGIAVDPYQIASKADLLTLATNTNDYGKCFILTADIDLDPCLPDGQVFTTAIIAADTNPSSGFNGFQGTWFTGIFDGGGFKIKNVTINAKANDYIALFGCVYYGGLVKNLGVENCSVNGRLLTASLVAWNWGGNISNCHSSGTIIGYHSSVGGLVGENYGSITNCFSISNVNGQNFSEIGGLVGTNHGSITSCYSDGTVSGYNNIGGLVGQNSQSVTNSYSKSEVHGFYGVGGLVGSSGRYNYITNCYSTGLVTGSSSVGGLVGSKNSTIVSGFWNTETSGQTTSDGGEGKTTAEMKTLSTFASAGWDFVCVWGIGNGQTYPYLKPFNGFNIADFNYSGMVDLADFAVFAQNWLNSQ